MAEPSDSNESFQAQVMQLHRASGLPVAFCKEYLESLNVEHRVLCIQMAEAGEANLHDPIEDEPSVRPIFEAVCQEVRQQMDELRRQEIAEAARHAPAYAEMMRGGIGMCHRYWEATKRILRERHGIEWRSPAEMNPWVEFE